MEVINESYIEIHSAPVVLPYNIVNEDESFGLFTIKMNKTAIRQIPFHFVFTIDTTLSMTEASDGQPSKMVYMQKTMIGMLKYLMEIDPNVYITIQTFNTEVNTIVNDLLLSKASITSLIDKIYGLVPDNSTNIQIALEYANKTIHSNFEKYPDDQHIHIFMTDGNANIGITSPELLINLIVEKVPNIFIGFGQDHNSEMLRKFSECKNAEYYFVDNLENASLVYAESIHNVLYSAMRDVEFRIVNGQLYDYATNKWTSVLHENSLSSECQKYYQLKTADKENVELHISGKNISSQDIEYESVVKVLPDLYVSALDDDEEFLPVDLTKYAYRKKVQELMYLAKNTSSEDDDDVFQDYYDPNDRASIKKDLKEVFKDIQQYTKENDLAEDGLLKMLCEDIYVTNKSLNTKNSRMYVSARQTSQGRQRSYNVGKTVDYNDMPFPKLRRQNTDLDLDGYRMTDTNTTCFASPTMVNTFNDVTICTQSTGQDLGEDFTIQIGSQSPTSED